MSKIQKYPASMILFHTIIAILMITVLVLGWQLDDNPNLEDWHKAFGLSVLFLAFLRIFNRMRVSQQIPASLNKRGSLQYILEKSVHGLLYVVMFSTPLLGWLLVSAHGEPISFFGWFDMPALIAENKPLAHTLKGLHGLSANLFFGLLLLHLAGAILHRLTSKDSIFRRIMPF